MSRYVAGQLTARDPLAAHAEAELDIDPEQLARPGHAAVTSFGSFLAGAALVARGAVGAALGRAPRGPAVLRNVIGGAIAMGVTYAVGTLIGAAGI